MTHKVIQFHELTTIDSIDIVRKNFQLPLDKTGKLEDVHSEIYFFEKITTIPEKENYLYISKDVVTKVLGKLDGKDEVVADIGIVVTFRFDNSNHFVKLSPHKTDIDKELSEWLTNIALATVRGVIFSEFRGTYVGSIIIPIIKPTDLT